MEIWKDINNYEGLYQVSNLGNVRSLDRIIYNGRGYQKLFGKNLVHGNSQGYAVVGLYKNTIRQSIKVHQLVAEAFLNHTRCGHKLVVNHINFIKNDNRVENLEIVSQRENANLKHIKSSSKYVGVHWHKSTKKWRSQITIGNKQIYLGVYDCEIKASNAYNNALNKL